jgi:hypothetical protein
MGSMTTGGGGVLDDDVKEKLIGENVMGNGKFDGGFGHVGRCVGGRIGGRVGSEDDIISALDV